jgi:hypothetical protein
MKVYQNQTIRFILFGALYCLWVSHVMTVFRQLKKSVKPPATKIASRPMPRTFTDMAFPTGLLLMLVFQSLSPIPRQLLKFLRSPRSVANTTFPSSHSPVVPHSKGISRLRMEVSALTLLSWTKSCNSTQMTWILWSNQA